MISEARIVRDAVGGFVVLHAATSLEVCDARDSCPLTASLRLVKLVAQLDPVAGILAADGRAR